MRGLLSFVWGWTRRAFLTCVVLLLGLFVLGLFIQPEPKGPSIAVMKPPPPENQLQSNGVACSARSDVAAIDSRTVTIDTSVRGGKCRLLFAGALVDIQERDAGLIKIGIEGTDQNVEMFWASEALLRPGATARSPSDPIEPSSAATDIQQRSIEAKLAETLSKPPEPEEPWGASATAKHEQLHELYREFLTFKDSAEFRRYGFGQGGRFSGWLNGVTELSDDLSYSRLLYERCEIVPDDLRRHARDSMNGKIGPQVRAEAQAWASCFRG